MIRLISFVTIIGIVLVTVLAAPQEKFNSKYDDIDTRSILENDRLREEYVGCFMGTNPCRTADMKFYRGVFSEALQTQCARCTEKQKENLNIVSEWFVKNKPDQWNTIVEKTVEDMKKRNGS